MFRNYTDWFGLVVRLSKRISWGFAIH